MSNGSGTPDYLKIIVPAIWDFLSRKYYTGMGLLLQWLVGLWITTSVVNSFLEIFHTKEPEPSHILESPNAKLAAYLFCWLVVSLLLLIFWCLKRKVPTFRRGQIGILIGPSHTREAKDELLNLQRNLRHEVRAKDFTGLFAIKKLPPNQRVERHEDALFLLGKAYGRVLIWGIFEKITRQGKEIMGFSTISVTCNLLPAEIRSHPDLLGDALRHRQWAWNIENTVDRAVVAENLGETSRFVVGLSLLAQRRFEEAQNIFGPLRLDVNSKYQQRRLPAPIMRFKQAISRAYGTSLTQEVRHKYLEMLYKEQLFNLDLGIVTIWSNKLEDALKVDEKDARVWIVLAIIRFLQGRTENAKEAIRTARQKSARVETACNFSMGFLLAFEGDLANAKKSYKNGIKDPLAADPDFIQPVLSFIDQAVKAYPRKPQLRFLLGMINDELGDQVVALEELKRFVSEAEGYAYCQHWVREAQRRIARIEQSAADNDRIIGTVTY